MMVRRSSAPAETLSDQVATRLSRGRTREAIEADPRDKLGYSTGKVITTGSTLLDLAISGGIYPEGGIPPGIMVEIFGPSGCGKTVLLCEIAGGVERQHGEIMFRDPEGRLNNQFAALFGFHVENADYSRPDTVPELFEPIRNWNPRANGINGVFADSLAALSTKMEMEGDDKYGTRRAKEFSEECRKTCRVLANRGFLMVCSNQVRQNIDAGPFEEKYKSPGGEAVGFYASLRLRCHSPVKTPREISVGGKKHKRTVGVHTKIEVYKSSIWEPYHTAPVHILYDYGIDDIRANLEFVKSVVGGTFYMLDETSRLDAGLERSIKMVEEGDLDLRVKRYTIQLWHELEEKFKVSRLVKRRE
jgi:RecA/RadA recombinase